MVVHSRDDRVVALEKVLLRSVPAIATQREIQIPKEHLPLVVLGTINELVLAAVVSVAVPVTDHMPQSERGQPLVDVDRGLHVGDITSSLIVDGINNREKIRVVVVERLIELLLPAPTVAADFLVAARGRKQLQTCVFIGEPKSVIEFKPIVDLIDFAIGIISVMTFHVCRVRLLNICVDRDVAAGVVDAVDDEVDKALIAVWQAQLACHPE